MDCYDYRPITANRVYKRFMRLKRRAGRPMIALWLRTGLKSPLIEQIKIDGYRLVRLANGDDLALGQPVLPAQAKIAHTAAAIAAIFSSCRQARKF